MKTSFMRLSGMPNKMLIVDDDELNCDVLANIFEADHAIVTAANGREGLAALDSHRASVCAILLDVNMPVMDGMEMLDHLADMGVPDNIPIFLITGETDGDRIKKAYDLGVMDVISKPISPNIVEKRVHSVIELYARRNHYQDLVALQNVELREKNRALEEMNKGMIEALATATEFRSAESGEHVLRIHDITHLFLTQSPLHLQFSADEIDRIAQASILHDVGKISIPDAILNKPGKLTKEEFETMKMHTVDGEKMLMQMSKLKNIPFYDHALTIARHHHERWDGSGYPDHLAGDDIPISAQVVSIADVYDALVSTRVYKPPFCHDEAVKMIVDGKCGIFNPDLLEYFKDISAQIHELYLHKNELAHEVGGNGSGEKE